MTESGESRTNNKAVKKKAVPKKSKSFDYNAMILNAGIFAFSKTIDAPIRRGVILVQNYKGVIDVLRRVPKEQGIAALFRGNFPNLMRYFPNEAFNYAFKHKFANMFNKGISKEANFWRWFAGNLVSGGAAGAASLCFVYPLDFAHVRLSADVGKGETREFKGMTDCLKKIVTSDGPRGLYRGFFVAIQGIIIYRALYFGLFDTAKYLFARDGKRLSFFAAWTVAQAINVSAGMLSYPWNTVQRRMMMQSGRKDVMYNNAYDCVTKIIKQEGMRALFKGCLPALVLGMPGAIIVAVIQEAQKYI